MLQSLRVKNFNPTRNMHQISEIGFKEWKQSGGVNISLPTSEPNRTKANIQTEEMTRK